MQLKETGIFDVWPEHYGWENTYTPTVYMYIACLFFLF